MKWKDDVRVEQAVRPRVMQNIRSRVFLSLSLSLFAAKRIGDLRMSLLLFYDRRF